MDKSNCEEESCSNATEQLVSAAMECSEDWTLLNFDPKDIAKEVKGAEKEACSLLSPRDAELEVNGPNDSHSDIDILDETEADVYDIASLESESVISSLSFMRSDGLRCRNYDHLHEDFSETSSINFRDELPANTVLSTSRQRAYVHTPNRGFNYKLNTIVALTLAAVIGLGIGNYIGLMDGLNTNQLSLAQVMKLRQLQDELENCMEHEKAMDELSSNENASICNGNIEHWKTRFENLFRENKGMKDLLEKAQQHLHQNSNSELNIEKECAPTATEEFQKLKLNMIVKQMEHLQLLKSLNQVKNREQQSQKRVLDLESENTILKVRLMEEEEDDILIAESLEEKISQLKNENDALKSKLEDDGKFRSLEKTVDTLNKDNMELKSALRNLHMQMNMDYDDEANVGDDFNNTEEPLKRLDAIRQRINQLLFENEDLKSTIARLRYTKETEPEPIDNSVEALEEQLEALQNIVDLEKEEAKKWKALFEAERAKSTENSKISEYQSNDFRNILMDSIIGNSDVLGTALKSMVESGFETVAEISKEVDSRIAIIQDTATELHSSLVSKWQSLNSFNSEENEFGSQKIIGKMAALLSTTMRKLQDSGDKFSTTQKPLESRITKLATRMSKISDNLETKWIEINKKLYRRLYAEEGKATADWYWERSKSRRTPSGMTEDGNWMLARAKNREIQRVDIEDSTLPKKGASWRDDKYNQYAPTPSVNAKK
ncbi:hypothetical protein HDE_02676 [Halotydeus destructor]|nr:hypothetical protein HDE_02676 [Halotydeus destructor]